MDQGLLADVNAGIGTYRLAFYLWSIVFYALCAAMIALPILVGVATEALGTRWVRILSTAAASSAGIATWAGLNIVVANFEKAFTMLEVARAENSIHPDNDKLLAAFSKAKELVGSYSPGVPQTGAAAPAGH
jgi:hypothetical protein